MDLVPTDFLLKPVADHDDLVQFRYDFTLQGKALDDGAAAPVVSEDANGDLIIEGYAAVFDGIDRQGENFAEGAFQRGIKSFLGKQAALCFHHKHEKVLGKVLDLREDKGTGLWMRARVDGAIKEHPELKTYYNQIRNGTLNGLSVGGFFKRALVKGQRKIADMDFTEISVTGVPVHSGTNFAVVAGKALDDAAVESPSIDDLPGFDDIMARIQGISAAFDAKALPSSHDPEAADAVASLLNRVQSARQTATSHARHSKHDDVKSHADALETDLAAHEAKLHRLAAKVGPLPNYNY